jgi:hypothetical protein
VSPWFQIRRCHRCNEVHEACGARVETCASCGARFAPFYFIDLSPPKGPARKGFPERPFPKAHGAKPMKTYRRIVGIVEWWSDAVESVDESLLPHA